MKLYIYEHCPFCVRARMAFGLKGVPVQISVILEGDAETPVRLIGKKMVPILEKPDGSHMGESLDIVRYVDHLGKPIFDGASDPRIDAWIKSAWPIALKLIIPRFTKGDFAELATVEARESYRVREEKAFGDLDALMAATPALIREITVELEALAGLLADRSTIDLSDILLWPILRSLTIVRGLVFPAVVQAYLVDLEDKTGVPLLFEQAA